MFGLKRNANNLIWKITDVAVNFASKFNAVFDLTSWLSNFDYNSNARLQTKLDSTQS